MDKLEAAMSKVKRTDLAGGTSKESRIEIRTTIAEKDEIQGLASELGLSVAEYLLRLHRYARIQLVRGA